MHTHGTAKLSRNRKSWTIAAEPHVLMKLRRVFGRKPGKVPKSMRLPNTLDACRDLQWFTQRFPLDVTPSDFLAERSEEHAQRQSGVRDLFEGRVDPRPFELAVPLRPYQAIAAEAMLRRKRLLLADDVGLGKTASAIGALTSPDSLPALIVTLAALPRQWEREVNRFAPNLRTHIIKKGTPYPLKGAAQGELFGRTSPDVLITTYHKLRGWADDLYGQVKTVIFDEVQELRTGISKSPPAKYQAAEQIASGAELVVGLTATPIYNYGGEFFSVLSIIDPDGIGTKSAFFSEWATDAYATAAKAKIRDPRAFGAYLRSEGMMLRRTREDVSRELPPCEIVIHHVESNPETLRQVKSNATRLAELILASSGAGFDKMRAAEELNTMLRMATGVAKAPYVAAFVRMLVESGEKVVLFGWHRSVYDIWLEQLGDLNPLMYTGSESPKQKADNVERFVKDADHKVLIVSLRSGAGLDGLQHASRIAVFGELDWSPGVHEQCTGRIFRDGQPDPVTAYMLLADSGSDPIVADVLGLKQSQIDGVRDPDRDLLEELEVDPNRIKRLAEDYLLQVGKAVPKAQAEKPLERPTPQSIAESMPSHVK